MTTAGGPVYQNMGFDYVKALSDTFFGIHEQAAFTAQNLDVQGRIKTGYSGRRLKKYEIIIFRTDKADGIKKQSSGLS